jgi:hypothetical protein
MSETTYIVGLDLGQAQDPSALAVAEQSRDQDGQAHYHVRHLHRWPLGTSYVAVVEEVVNLLARPPLPGCTLAVDGTGCGRSIVDMLRWRPNLNATVRAILITAGHAVREDEETRYLHIAKVQLVSCMQKLFGTRRIKFAAALPLAKMAEQELRNFRAKITPAGSEQFLSDWREGQHDDIVLAVAMACWLGENVFTGSWDPTPPKSARSEMDRLDDMGVFLPDDWGKPW